MRLLRIIYDAFGIKGVPFQSSQYLSIIFTVLFSAPSKVADLSKIKGLVTMQREIEKKIREIGRVFNPELIGTMTRLYTPLLAESPREGVKVTRDISYGPHERQKMDVYQPDY